MLKRVIAVFILTLFASVQLRSADLTRNDSLSAAIHVFPDTITIEGVQLIDTTKNFKKEKLVASILAFPVPFGFIGLHRVYLGSEPWVPVVYLVTGGGGCGLLPLIDFIFIVSATEEEFAAYENNPRLFMFVE